MSLWPRKKHHKMHTTATHEKPKQVVPLTKEQRYELRKAMDAIDECDDILASLVEEIAKRKAEARDLFWISVSGITGVERYEAIQLINWVACQVEIYDFDATDPVWNPPPPRRIHR